MQRLIEASASKELLLQELASIVHENFPVEFVVVARMDENGKPEALVSKGIGLEDANRACLALDPSMHMAGNGSGSASLIHLSSGSDGVVGRQNKLTFSSFLYLRFRGGSGAESELDRLQPLVRQVELGLEACSLRAAATVVAPARAQDQVQVVMPGFIVGSPPMFEVVDKIHKIRTSDVTVLITGESGTGKELVARALHAESARARAIFLPFNCTATPRDLIESQLFGHRRGAFTGATTNYPGMVRAAEGGTLFLDEIGDVALEVQPKLMRFLQEGEIQPLGETRPTKVDVRVVAATNSDLERAVEEGRFREDLFHRLNIIRIHVPALRERREEIPALASFFLDHFAARSGKPRLSLTQDAMDALTGYEWPGNVRQLRNEIERVTAYAADGAKVSAADLTPEVVIGSRRRSEMAVATGSARTETDRYSSEPREPGLSSDCQPTDNASPLKLKDAVAELEGRLIRDALARNRNNVSRTAFELGLSRRGLRLKLAQLAIDKQ
jgi:DNA-binding NtrC family response regulator